MRRCIAKFPNFFVKNLSRKQTEAEEKPSQVTKFITKKAPTEQLWGSFGPSQTAHLKLRENKGGKSTSGIHLGVPLEGPKTAETWCQKLTTKFCNMPTLHHMFLAKCEKSWKVASRPVTSLQRTLQHNRKQLWESLKPSQIAHLKLDKPTCVKYSGVPGEDPETADSWWRKVASRFCSLTCNMPRLRHMFLPKNTDKRIANLERASSYTKKHYIT